MIKNGSTVTVHYTGKLSDGEVFDTSEGREPLTFTLGSDNIINGFQDAVLGKKIGDKVSVTIPTNEAYGPIREDLFVQVPKDKMPGDVEIGTVLQANSGNGEPVTVRVKEITEEFVTIDGNHPLANQDLSFDIEVVEVTETAEA